MDRTMGRRTLGVVGLAASAAASFGIWAATSASAATGTVSHTSVSTSASPVALPPAAPTPGESCQQQLAAAAERAKFHLPTLVQKRCE